MDIVSGGRLAAAVSQAAASVCSVAAMATATGLTKSGSARATPASAAASLPGAWLIDLTSWSALSHADPLPLCFRSVICVTSPPRYGMLARG